MARKNIMSLSTLLFHVSLTRWLSLCWSNVGIAIRHSPFARYYVPTFSLDFAVIPSTRHPHIALILFSFYYYIIIIIIIIWTLLVPCRVFIHSHTHLATIPPSLFSNNLLPLLLLYLSIFLFYRNLIH